jgi:hypothetical protein
MVENGLDNYHDESGRREAVQEDVRVSIDRQNAIQLVQPQAAELIVFITTRR